MEIFKVENLSFSYASAEGKEAISQVSFSVKEGDFLAVCGSSGSGKTTLLRLLKPSLSPKGLLSGSIYFNGTSIENLSPFDEAQKIGFVFQDPHSQIVTDKVWHELAFGLENLGVPPSTISLRIAEMASFFGIQSWYEKDTQQLSGGQKQILNLASVMVMQPSVLILDEPTSQLDPIATTDFLNILAKINEDLGTTIIITEHSLDQVLPLASKALVLDQGSVLAHDIPANVGAVLAQENHRMFDSMPAPLRAYNYVYQKGYGKNLPCPTSLGTGRKWLTALFEKASPRITSVPVTPFAEGSMTPLLSFRDIYFRYEKATPDILKGLKGQVYKGEIFSILGGNGEGKTSLLSVVSGENKAYSGSVKFAEKNFSIGVLPQNPQALFVEKEVGLELNDNLEIANLVGVSHLMKSHPYDISGGEQQRVALGKVLLSNPSLLLLDEPTKGMDNHFKDKMGEVLTQLARQGTTIILVTHDIEFSSKFSSRCALLFNGSFASIHGPNDFFKGNNFYTTATNKMSKHLFENAVTPEDLASLIIKNLEAEGSSGSDGNADLSSGGNADLSSGSNADLSSGSNADLSSGSNADQGFEADVAENNPSTNGSGLGSGGNADQGFEADVAESKRPFPATVLPTVASFKIPASSSKNIDDTLGKRPLLYNCLTVLFFALMALAIFATLKFANERAYLISACLGVICAIVPFFLSFERRKPSPRLLVLIAVLVGFAVVSRGMFFMLPQIKPVVALVIIGASCLGPQAGFLLGALSALVSNFLFGQGPWTLWQMLALGAIGLLAGFLAKTIMKNSGPVAFCVFGFIAGFFIYGIIVDIWTLFAMTDTPNIETALMLFGLALPFNLALGVSTSLFLLLLYKPMKEKINRITVKYGV